MDKNKHFSVQKLLLNGFVLDHELLSRQQRKALNDLEKKNELFYCYFKRFRKLGWRPLKPNPTVFKKAAMWIDEGIQDFCCNAIGFDTEEHIFFKKYFEPKNSLPYMIWFGNHNLLKNRQTRILALLLAAEIARNP